MLSFGQLFGSNFWSSFKAQPSESIEKLLAKDDCQLEELLDDSDLLQECKNNNKNLVKYLNREKIKELIDLITVMPETDEHNRGHKYPFLANEVFNCDIQEISDRFFISPADDVEPEEPEDEASDEGEKDKFGSNFEKDKSESGSDSEEEGAPEGENKSTDEKDDLKAEDLDKDEDKPTEGEAQESDKKEEDAKEEGTQEAVELDVEDKVEEKKLDTPEATPVPADAPAEETTENAQKEPETNDAKTEEEKSPEDTKSGEASGDSQKTESAPADTTETVEKDTDQKEEEKQSEETPESDKKPAEEDAPQTQESTENTEDSQDDASTHVSEAASEATQQTEAPKEPLSTNKYDLFDYLNKFIDTDIQLNDVLAGYYARVCNILIQKKSDEVAKYYYTNAELLYKFAYHSYSKSLTDTVIKILDTNTFKEELSEEEIQKVRREFISNLLERLADDKSEVSYEYSLNIFQIFNELTYKKAFYELLIEQEVLDKLKDILTKPESPESNQNAAIRILNVLISHLRDYLSNNTQQNNTQTFMDDNDEVVMEDDENKDSESRSIEEQVAKHHLVTFLKEQIVDHLVEQLDKAPETAILDFQYADKQYVLGKKRLACVNLMESLVELDDSSMRAKIMETRFYEQLFDLFLEFRFNTFLQLHLDNIFHRILKDQNTTNEQKVAFLEKLQIFTKLPAFWKDNQQFAYPSSREFRHGYLAFTTRFANTLRDLAKTVTEIEPFLEKQEWKEFVEQDVNAYNEKNAIVLANRGGDRKDSDEFEEMDDDKFKDLDERDDLEDDDDKEEDEYDEYSSNRNSMRKTLQEYDASKAREQHENLFVGENIEKDEEENDLFSGLNSKPYGGDDSSDDDKPIGGSYDDDSDDDDSENEKEDVSESSSYYDNSYWQVDQYNIEDLLQG
jgi:hypothetical protein